MTEAEQLQATLDELQRNREATEAASAAIARDRTERNRANRMTKIATVVASILLVVDLCALGLIIKVQQDAARVQRAGTARGKRIEQSVAETHKTSVQLTCAITASQQYPGQDLASREASQAALNACIAKALKEHP